MPTNPLPTDKGPFYLAVSASLTHDGSVQYRIHRMDAPGDRLRADLAGEAVPTCAHLTCRLANLGAAAVDWAYLLGVGDGPPEFHPEQMELSLASE